VTLARCVGPEGDLAALPRAPSGEAAYLAAYAVGRSLRGEWPRDVPGLVDDCGIRNVVLVNGGPDVQRRAGEALRRLGVPQSLSRPLPGEFLSGLRYECVPRDREPRLDLVHTKPLSADGIRRLPGAVLLLAVPEQTGFDLPMLEAIARARCPIMTFHALVAMAAHRPAGRPQSRQALLEELIGLWRQNFEWASGIAHREPPPGLKE